jgi:hypothetical protein
MNAPCRGLRCLCCTEVLLDVAPATLGLTQVFEEIGKAMRVVPLTARLGMLLDPSADVTALLTVAPFETCLRKGEASHEGGDDMALVGSLARRLFEIEMLLFPHALNREWTQEKRNAFRRRLACVRTSSRLALLLHQFAASALESLTILAAAQCEKPAADARSTKSSPKVQHFLPVVGDEVVYVLTGHRQHLREKTEPPRPWEAEADPDMGDHQVMCVVENVTHYKPVPLNVFKARDFADEMMEKDKKGDKEPRSQACMCVRLRPNGAKKQAGSASCSLDGSFQVSVYLDSSLPEFVVNKTTFEQTCKLKVGTRVKMWFANVETAASHRKGASRNSGGTWYHGSVVNNLYAANADPWECIQVRWDNDTQITYVCPWELQTET